MIRTNRAIEANLSVDLQEGANIQTKKDRVFHQENSADAAVSASVPSMASVKGEQTVI
jgi:transcriptional regulator